jgi:hypothetical protein
LIIAHSGYVPNENFIVVIRVDSGTIASARIYGSGSYDTYN